MELMQLKYFITVAEEENLSAAATKLFISQPALSRSISKLESELGVKLFNRTSNRIRLNENGQMFIRYLTRASQELDNGVRMLRQDLDRETGFVTVATSSHGILASPCAEYLVDHPKIHFMHYIQGAKQMAAMLHKRQIDFCVTSKKIQDPQITWVPIIQDEFLVYVHQDNPLSQKSSVDFAELANQRLIFYDYGLETTDVLYDLCYQANFSPDLFFAGNENEVPFLLLDRNLGVFILPASMHYFHMSEPGRDDSRPPYKALRIHTPRVSYELGIATLNNHTLSGTANSFIEYLRGYFRERNDMLREYLERDFPLD